MSAKFQPTDVALIDRTVDGVALRTQATVGYVLDGGATDIQVPADAVDPNASMEELVTVLSPAMFRVAKSIVGDRALAEDVVQDALLRVWQHRDEYRGDAPLKNWVLRITHNCAVSALRKRRDDVRDPAVLPEGDAPVTADIERSVAGKAAIDDLWLALDRLDEVSRTIVVLREVERLSYEEISEVLNLPLPTIKTRLFRARRILSEHLKEWR
jgi:RNA polymerase sigma-70 factor, ECF subfamily